MNRKELLDQLKGDYEFRSFLTSGISVFATTGYLIFNFALGLRYRAVWNFSISFYYLVLVLLRGLVLFWERKWRYDDAAGRKSKRTRLFRHVTGTRLLMDLALVAPIYLMVHFQRMVTMTAIPAIATAAYTTYKVTLAVRNYCRTRKHDNLSLFSLRIINLKDAVASVLTLQNTMVMVFGSGPDMQTLTAYTSAGMLLGMIGLTVALLRRGRAAAR